MGVGCADVLIGKFDVGLVRSVRQRALGRKSCFLNLSKYLLDMFFPFSFSPLTFPLLPFNQLSSLHFVSRVASFSSFIREFTG